MQKLCLLLFLVFSGAAAFSQEFYLFVGPYTEKGSKARGIYVYRFNAYTGSLSPVSIAEGVENPSYLALSANGRYLYSVNQYHAEKPSSISAFAIDKTKGQLRLLDKQPSDDGTAYISTDSSGRWVFVGNYTAGTLAAYPVQPDGSLGPASQTIAHKGTGPNKERQDKAHVHSVVFSPDERFLFAPDLGTDQVSIYQFDRLATTTPLSPASQAYAESKPG
ncbi:MAG: beta-propeller fold lactonase family protein, partial [Bacteroidetes bacterium]|nr:beta-propeller fold lactonase family protein [Bacteroidota bacterium]